jgi:hypothetical protein
MIAAVHAANAALPGPEREVLALLAESGLGYDGVAELMGLTPAAVGSLAATARLRLAEAAPVPERCRPQLPRLAGLIDGETLAAPNHPARCPDCAAAEEAMRRADAAYRAWQP